MRRALFGVALIALVAAAQPPATAGPTQVSVKQDNGMLITPSKTPVAAVEMTLVLRQVALREVGFLGLRDSTMNHMTKQFYLTVK